MSQEYELAIVMPVYNEQDCICEVVDSWNTMLGTLGIRYVCIILNDGSKDETQERLSRYGDSDTVTIVNKDNSGHGPTILEGYHQAVEKACWVFQCDSDDEMPAEAFPALWDKRQEYDVLFGYRAERIQSRGRKLISAISRLTVRMLFGSGVVDVNTPYRLMRTEYLKVIIDQIPDKTFAPNVIIAGSFARAKLRIYNTSVAHQHRRTGEVSIVRWKLWKSAFRAFFQTLFCRPRIDR